MAEKPSFNVDNFRIAGQYVYDEGLQLGTYCQPESVDKVRNMELDESDVIVTSYPKTGTTFLQEVVWLIRNNANVQLANQSFTSHRTPFVEDSYKDNIELFYSLPKPRSLKTHLPFRLLPKQASEKGVKVVYIYRNPRDTLVSFYHFYRSTVNFNFFPGSWDEFLDMFYRVNKGMLYYGNFFEHFRGFWERRNDEKVFVISFEELLRDHAGSVSKIAGFLKVDLDECQIQTIVEATKFDSMKDNPKTNFLNNKEAINYEISKYMRKGQIGDWVNYFSEEQLEKLDQMEIEKLGDLDVKFVYG